MSSQKGPRSRVRTLTAHERELWRQVTRFVTPMAPVPDDPVPQAEEKRAEPVAIRVGAGPRESDARAAVRKLAPAPPPLPPIAPLEQRLRQRLARGRTGVDAVLDLHGMRQNEAHSALRAFVRRAQGAGARVVLVVTGKGADDPGLWPDEPRGVLRRQAPHWLTAADLRDVVLGFDYAADRHGGGGALYVRLRGRKRGGAGPLR